MKMKGWVLAALAALILSGSSAAVAATGSAGGPKSTWTQMQKFEFYLGQLGGALNLCKNFGLANQLYDLAKLSPYGREGWRSLLSFDYVSGARCGGYANKAREVLKDSDKLHAYLTELYDCPGGECAPEGADDSASAPCRPEAEQHLSSLPVQKSDVKSIWMFSRFVGATHVGVGKPGHEAWVRLNSCSGWLVIELSQACSPRQTYTRGNCAVEGIAGN